MARYFIATFLTLFFFCLPARATELRSSSFVDLDPVILFLGGRSTSTNFQLISGLGQMVIGESTSTAFITRSGFFYFPLIVTTPVVSVVPGDAEAILTWTAAVGTLGWNIGSYQVGQATAPEGPWSYAAVGSVLSSTRRGLANGTVYYFVVRGLDAVGTPVVSSSIISVLPQAVRSVQTAPSPAPATGAIAFSGASAPGSTVVLLQNGSIIERVAAGADGAWRAEAEALPAGPALFTLYAATGAAWRSGSITVSVNIMAGKTVTVPDILLPPIIALDFTAVRQGETVPVIGYAAPESAVTLWLDGKKDFFFNLSSAARGEVKFDVPTAGIPKGDYLLQARAHRRGITSEWSKTLPLTVGEQTIPAPPPAACQGKGDFNRDCRVDLIDFSILIYWFDRPNPPARVDLYRDNRVDLIDFSILMYYWTG